MSDIKELAMLDKANHEEALNLACMKRNESNLARAYLELYVEHQELNERLVREIALLQNRPSGGMKS